MNQMLSDDIKTLKLFFFVKKFFFWDFFSFFLKKFFYCVFRYFLFQKCHLGIHFQLFFPNFFRHLKTCFKSFSVVIIFF